MRTCTMVFVLALAILASSCGDDPQPPPKEREVELTLGSPADAEVVRSKTVEVSGSVKPARASVQVLGRDVAVDAGRFSTQVALEPGANLVDVAASASGRRPDFAALRIVFEQRVALPDVVGRDADSAQEELEGLGLAVKAQDAGGFFDPILPGDPKVCAMEPEPGTQVLPGSEVTMRVARDC